MSFHNGKFRARAIPGGAVLGKTSKDTDQVGITFKLLEGPEANRLIAYYGYFTDATAEGTIEAMRNAGWLGDDLRDLSSIGREDGPDVVLVIRDEANLDGVMQSRVKYVNRVAGSAIKQPMTEAERNDFARRMKGRVAAFNQKQAQSTAQARPPRTPPKHEESRGDDIPF